MSVINTDAADDDEALSVNSFQSAEEASEEEVIAGDDAAPPRRTTQLSSGSHAIAITPGSPHLSFTSVKKLSFSAAPPQPRASSTQPANAIGRRHHSRHSSFFDVHHVFATV
jgi:hypothetical protein